MRKAKIVRRSDIPQPAILGVHNGRMYYGSEFEDKTPTAPYPKAALHAPLSTGNQVFLNAGNTIGVEASTVKLSADYPTYSAISQVDGRAFTSKLGVTRGLEFRCVGGKLYDSNGDIWYRPSGESTNGNSVATPSSIGVTRFVSIIHETENSFVLSVVGRSVYRLSNAILIMNKVTRAVLELISGSFSAHALGQLPDDLGSSTAILICANGLLSEGSYPTLSADRIGGQPWVVAGGVVRLLMFKNHPTLDAGSFYYRSVAQVGGYSNSTADYHVASARTIVAFHQSLCEYDEDGKLVAFSFAGAEQTLVGDLNINLTTYVVREKLRDNLALHRVTFNVDSTITRTFQKLALPQSYLDAEWQTYGPQSTNLFLALVTGLAFVYQHEGQSYLGVFLDSNGFEFYARVGAASAGYYAERKSPTLSATLMRWPLQANNQLAGDATIVDLGVDLGAGINWKSLILDLHSNFLYVPSFWDQSANLDKPALVSNGKIAKIGLHSSTVEHLDLAADFGFPSNYRVECIGTEAGCLYVHDQTYGTAIYDNGPEVTLTCASKTATPGSTVQVTVTVSRPSTISLRVIGGTIDNLSTKTLDVQDTATVDVALTSRMRVIVTSCEELEV